MSYTPLSWVAGETVTATKMNIGAANMASFNDGTGITDAAILNRHLASQAVTSDNIDFATFDHQQITRSYGGGVQVGYNPIFFPDTVGTDIGSDLFTYTNDGKITAGSRRIRLSISVSVQVSTSGRSVLRASFNDTGDAGEFASGEGSGSAFNLSHIAFDILLNPNEFVLLSLYTSIAGSTNPVHTKMIATATAISN